MKNIRNIFATMCLCLIALTINAKDRLVVAKAPEGVELKHDFEVEARIAGGEWQPLDCYAIRVARVVNAKSSAVKTSVAKLEFDGKVDIRIKSIAQDIKTFKVRPDSYGIAAHKEGNTIEFSLSQPRYLSIEVNGDIYNNLQLFADNIIEKPKVKKKDLIYFGPGLHDLGNDSVAVTSGKTVFIDNGAVVKGWLSVYKANNVKVMGHGIVMPERHEGIMVRYSKNVVVDGPLTTQLPVGGSDSVEVKNAKVMSWYGWGDGFNIFASNNVKQEHLFARTSDDCSTIYCTRKGYQGGCRNISISDCIYWADVAHPIMIGLHGDIERNEIIENVVYDKIDILEHAEYQIDYQGCIGINNGDNITVRNVAFRNFNVDDITRGMLFNFRVCYNKKYCTAPGRGIEDILVENFTYNGSHANMSVIAGYAPDRMARNITFKNLKINGTVISDDMPEKPKWYKTSDFVNMFVGEHTDGIKFIR